MIELTDWKLGTSEFDQVGWKTCELMRRGYGELRPLEVAPAHVFRFDESVEARALLLQIFSNQWIAIIIPILTMFFISIDEERLWFHVHDDEIAEYVVAELKRWSPQVVQPSPR